MQSYFQIYLPEKTHNLWLHFFQVFFQCTLENIINARLSDILWDKSNFQIYAMGHFICFLDSLNIDGLRHAEKFYLVVFTK